MNRKPNNKIVVDLKKVQYMDFMYENQYGQRRYTKPKFSVHGQIRDPNEKAFGRDMTMRQLAKELGITDVWTPRLYIELSANHSLVYTGDKAVALWREWCSRVFKDVITKKKGKK